MKKQRIYIPVKEILELCEDHGFEIVSFGLAPNPNGFCFEDGATIDDFEGDWESLRLHQKMKDRLARLLEGLDSRCERQLREIIFGGES